MALLGAICFGEEFHERTLALLLTQPLARRRIWNQKMSTVSLAVLAAVLLEVVLLAAVSRCYPPEQVRAALEQVFSREEPLMAGVFMVATVCSCGYWTLIARSIIGGLVFTVAAQFLTTVIAGLVYARVAGHAEPFHDAATFNLLAVLGMIYSAFFLWLGRRKFLGLEIKETAFGAAGARRQIPFPALAFLVSRPGTSFRNLARKEIRLLQPIFQMAGVFCICWFGVVLLQWMWPSQRLTYLFDVMTSLYAPITGLLAGCLTLGEEKALGLAEAQLTLPFSPRLQWLAKLVVCAATATLLCLCLPFLLFWSTGAWLDLHPDALISDGGRGLKGVAVISGLAFLLGFWAMPHLVSTIRAAIAGVVGFILLGAFLAFGIWLGNRSGGLLETPLVSIMCRFHLSPALLENRAIGAVPGLVCALVALIIAVMLYQSLKLFCRPAWTHARLGIHSALLAFIVLGCAFLSVDFTTAVEHLPNSAPVVELRSALNAIVRSDVAGAVSERHIVPLEALQGRVSTETEFWLRGATVSYEVQKDPDPRFLDPRFSAFSRRYGLGPYSYSARIQFKDGTVFDFPGGPLPWPRAR
jgi:hypothetical protein